MPMHAANRAASPPSRWYLSRLLQTPLGQYYLRSSQNYYGAGANNAADDDGGEQAFAVDAGADAAAEAHKGYVSGCGIVNAVKSFSSYSSTDD